MRKFKHLSELVALDQEKIFRDGFDECRCSSCGAVIDEEHDKFHNEDCLANAVVMYAEHQGMVVMSPDRPGVNFGCMEKNI